MILLCLAGLVLVGFATFRAGPAPTIAIESELPGIGKRTAIHVTFDEPKRGLGAVRVEFVQGDRVAPLAARNHTPLKSWQFWGERTAEDVLSVEVGSETLETIAEGPARIRAVADRAGAWLRFPSPAVQELALEVKLKPPVLQVLSTSTYVTQGGCEAVVYRVGESSVRDGVQAGDWWFPGYPLPGGEERQRFALFGVAHDLDDPDRIRLVAYDDVGNEAQASLIDKFTHIPLEVDTIPLSDRFMGRVVPAILAQTPELREKETLLETYLAINGELRKKNAETLVDLARDSVPEFLWKRPFMMMRNAKVMSGFADRRTYTYNGKAVDQQDHLGFDLASTRAAEIQSANDGRVVLARYFGIYGNAVAIDHGYGLMSLYGHLSSIAVEEGQSVQRGETIGRSGETGLAGGDHLHFTMLLHGMPVNPREWWDGHWIGDRLGLKLGPALPFQR